MNVMRRLLYLVSFVGMAIVAALALDRTAHPSMGPLLVFVVVAATAAAAPGLIHRRAWPIALVTVPIGAYLVVRTQLPLPSDVHGLQEHVSFYLQQVRDGVRAYMTTSFPLEGSSSNVQALFSMIVYVVSGVSAFVSLSLRKALPGLVMPLVLLGFGATVDGAERSIWLTLAFLLFAGSFLALSRSLERTHWSPMDAFSGVATAMTASLLALTLLGATSVSASQPWQNWRTWDLTSDESKRLTFDWMQNYPSLLDPGADLPALRVKSRLASYWRANALDFFSGVAWTSGWSYGRPLQAGGGGDTYKYEVPRRAIEPPGRTMKQEFEILSISSDYVFTGGSPKVLRLREPTPIRATAAQSLRLDRPIGANDRYEVIAVVPSVKPADLVHRGRDYPADVERFAVLPFPTPISPTGEDQEAEWRALMSERAAGREWLGLPELNRSIVGNATDPYAIALRIEQFLRSGYQYSLTPPTTTYRSPYAAFLFETKVGYCQHFAGAMALLLRFNGIPARVAVGFTAGERVAAETFEVSTNDAHAWVEVYFPGLGWLPFDPTPGRDLPGAGASSTSSGFVNPFDPERGSAASPSQPLDRIAPGLDPALTDARAGTGDESPSGGRLQRLWLVLGALTGATLVWPFGRAAYRARRLRRGTLANRLEASVALVHADLRDNGMPVPRSQTLDETCRQLRHDLGLDASHIVARIQAVVFGGRPARKQDLADIIHLRRELRRRVRERKGLAHALRARYGLTAVSSSERGR